ncbi:hypothetical protein EIP86_009060 [Pleurotus ostreatoroseus]|nr:hypothetical protein EIP86_009060 [Pleurotus ostreatoroseus]
MTDPHTGHKSGYAGKAFIREDVYDALGFKHSQIGTDSRLFGEEDLKHFPKIKAWYNDPDGKYAKTFAKMSKSQFEAYKKDAVKASKDKSDKKVSGKGKKRTQEAVSDEEGSDSAEAIYPLIRLHIHQRQEPRQPHQTGWKKSVRLLIQHAFDPESDDLAFLEGHSVHRDYAEDVYSDLDMVFELLGIDPLANGPPTLFDKPKVVLCTPRLDCVLCPPSTRYRSLRRRIEPISIQVLGRDFQWRSGLVFAAHCRSCGADYYPDRITYRNEQRQRRQKLEYDAIYLRISKHGLYVDRAVAYVQESAVREFRAGWANFANFVNNSLTSGPKITNRQSQRLFMEHFARRLLVAHNKTADFTCDANASTPGLAASVRTVIGVDGGMIEASLHHGCLDCTHRKRYRADLIAEGANLNADSQLMAGESAIIDPAPNTGAANVPTQPLPPGLPQLPPVQEAPASENAMRGYVRMVVMDGKTLGHRTYVVSYLVAYRWYDEWAGRFARLSYPGVRRVVRQQRRMAEEAGNTGPGFPEHRVQLPALGNVEGQDVVHTFRAQTVYCVETFQYACGMPVGWGKCYRSESSPQVLALLNRIWGPGREQLRPSFASYDDACDLLRHIVTQNPADPWISSTKFIVDAWHYIGHRATDVLCRLWCNPTPKNGSQPDLIRVEADANGNVHETRAFNTETAEQFNAWLNGYEAPLRQMTDVHFDFFMHVLFLLYAETVQKRIEKKDRGLPDDFLAETVDNCDGAGRYRAAAIS